MNGPLELVNATHVRGYVVKNHAREVAGFSWTLMCMEGLVAQMSQEMDFRLSLGILHSPTADRAAETFQCVVPERKLRMRHFVVSYQYESKDPAYCRSSSSEMPSSVLARLPPGPSTWSPGRLRRTLLSPAFTKQSRESSTFGRTPTHCSTKA